MNRNGNYGGYAVAVAILVVGLAAFDVPLGALATFGLLLVCPLMMLLMMRGMGGGVRGHEGRDARPDEPPDRTADRRARR